MCLVAVKYPYPVQDGELYYQFINNLCSTRSNVITGNMRKKQITVKLLYCRGFQFIFGSISFGERAGCPPTPARWKKSTDQTYQNN